jgi:Domain of unknown function (DUF4259)
MGAWGAGIYDNDDAADWAGELAEHGLDAVRAALDGVLDADYVESPDGACALAAADVVARLKAGGGEQSPYCEDVVSWVAANRGPLSDELVDKAMRAIARVRSEDSELAELWAEDGATQSDWLTTISSVEQRLSA